MKRIFAISVYSMAISMSLFDDMLENAAHAQDIKINYDESKVPEYRLPELLIGKDGKKIENSNQWKTTRRAEILRLFSDHMYGHTFPHDDIVCQFEVVESDKGVLDGLADRKQIKIVCTRKGKTHSMNLLIYLPAQRESSVPLFVGLNFYGNQTINADPEIILPSSWVRNRAEWGITDNVATEQSRGRQSGRWPVELIIRRGYGVATMYYGDIDPDFDDGFGNGVHSLFEPKELDVDKLTSISAWAWGLGTIMDYLESDDEIDEERVALLGHSRLGKTSLWAGANDERFAIVISNNSGCGGAALSRRAFGETVQRINTAFPHWFCKKFKSYNSDEASCPVDQHMLIACMSPRPVYIASASEDLWADPRGEFLAAAYADPVYNLFDLVGLGIKEFPKVDTSVGKTIGYHVRTGKHDVKEFDWKCYLDFADRHFNSKN